MKIRSKWDLSILYSGDDDPKIDEDLRTLEQKNYVFVEKWKDREDYLKDPKVLKAALDEYEELERLWGTGGAPEYYFSMRQHQDQTDTSVRARYQKIDELSTRIENDMQFFMIRLSKVPIEQQKLFLESVELEPYRYFLERLFIVSRYILSEAEEKIDNLKGNTSYNNWLKLMNSWLSKQDRIIYTGKAKELTNFNEILSHTDSKDKKVRDSAAKALNDIFSVSADIAEAELNSILENKKVEDELRGYSRPDEARYLHDDIETEVVDLVIEKVRSRFDISRRYYKLKAKVLGKKKLEYHERNVPVGVIGADYPYPAAVRRVHKVLSRLEPEFGEIFAMLSDGHIDALPKRGKTHGAFCASRQTTLPVFILTNHCNNLSDVLTIAHEAGHAINDELMKKSQNSLYYGTTLATAEVASTFMEDFVLRDIIDGSDDQDLKLAVMMMKLNDDISSIFRQAASILFERDLHALFREKGYLSKQEIGKLFSKHMKDYMGPYVIQSPGSENWWVHWGHIRHFFYNYSYVSGLLISKGLQAKVHEDAKFIQRVKDFLSIGLSDSPVNIFGKLGIDLHSPQFWDKSLQEIDDLLKETEKLVTIRK